MENLNTILERLTWLKTVTKKIDNIPYSRNELSLAIEGRDRNLQIWIANEKSISEGCGKQLICMRLDEYQGFSVPLNIERAKYIHGENSKLIQDLAIEFPFGEIEATDENLNKLLDRVKDLKYRKIKPW